MNSEDEEAAKKERQKAEKCKRKQERRDQRTSIEEKLDSLSSTLKVMQEIMLEKGIFDKEKQTDNERKKMVKGTSDNDSVTTIYHNAVPKGKDVSKLVSPLTVELNVDPEVSFRVKGNRDSSSSEDRIDTSNELMEIDNHELEIDQTQFIAECKKAARQKCMNEGNGADEAMDDGEKVIWQAEASKARLYATPGKDFDRLPNWQSGQRQNNASFVTVVDENYLVIGSHIDPNLQLKIINNEYVDFARLIPKHGVTANGNYDQ